MPAPKMGGSVYKATIQDIYDDVDHLALILERLNDPMITNRGQYIAQGMFKINDIKKGLRDLESIGRKATGHK